MFSFLTSNWLRYSVIALLVTSLGGMWWHYNHIVKENAVLSTQIESSEAKLEALTTEYEKNVASLQLIIVEEKQRREETQALIEEINNAKPEDDGPIAPVLRNTLDSLLK